MKDSVQLRTQRFVDGGKFRANLVKVVTEAGVKLD